MPRRHPDGRARQGAPPRPAGPAARRRAAPPPPSRPRSESRAGGGRAPGGPEWWQASGGEARPAARAARAAPRKASPPRMPPLPAAAQRVARRSALRPLLLPPRFLDRAPWTRVHPEPRERGKDRRGPARAAREPREPRDPGDCWGALLGQLLPSRFQTFLRQLGTPWVESLEPQTSDLHQQRSLSEQWWGQTPSYPSFLPHLRCPSSRSEHSLNRVSSRQIPALGPIRRGHTLGPIRREHPQPTEVTKANKPCGLQAPKLKAALCHSSSEASGPYRRCSPFRVRFADETLQDTAFRYWERRCALQQGVSGTRRPGPAPSLANLEPVLGSIRRWLESLPATLEPRPREATGSRARPGLTILGRQSRLSEDASSRSSTQWWQRDRKAFLGTPNSLSQAGKVPCSWSQQLEAFLPRLDRKRCRPKGYQLLLPPALQ